MTDAIAAGVACIGQIGVFFAGDGGGGGGGGGRLGVSFAGRELFDGGDGGGSDDETAESKVQCSIEDNSRIQ